jgi:hypothetical protein
MRLRIVKGSCGGGSCPTLYATDRDTYVVQGYTLEGHIARELALAEGETAVEVPRSMIEGVRWSDGGRGSAGR